jgi:hypothetical protein
VLGKTGAACDVEEAACGKRAGAGDKAPAHPVVMRHRILLVWCCFRALCKKSGKKTLTCRAFL